SPPLDAQRGCADLVVHQLELGPARGSSRHAGGNVRRGALRVRHGAAAPHPGKRRRQARPARPRRRASGGHRVGERPRGVTPLTARERLTAALEWGVIPAVPVPFRGNTVADDALQAYADWMAAHQVAGVAVWAHTGRGLHLSSQQRRQVLAAGRAALPMSTIVAGADSIAMAAEAKAGGADAIP